MTRACKSSQWFRFCTSDFQPPSYFCSKLLKSWSVQVSCLSGIMDETVSLPAAPARSCGHHAKQLMSSAVSWSGHLESPSPPTPTSHREGSRLWTELPSDNPAVFKPLWVNLSFCKIVPSEVRPDWMSEASDEPQRHRLPDSEELAVISKAVSSPQQRKGWSCCLRSVCASGDSGLLKMQDPAIASHPRSPRLFSSPSAFCIILVAHRKGTGNLEVKQSGESGFPVCSCWGGDGGFSTTSWNLYLKPCISSGGRRARSVEAYHQTLNCEDTGGQLCLEGNLLSYFQLLV